MVHGPVYRGIFPTPLAFLHDVRRAKVGLLGPQSRFLSARKIETVHADVEAVIERSQHEERQHR